MMRRVLVVDDEANVRLTISEALARPDLEVRTAASGEEALEIAETVRFDLVLLDLRMPGMDGMEVLRRLVAMHPAIRIALVTAHGTVANAVEAMKLGALDVVPKPVSLRQIRELVDRILMQDSLPADAGHHYDGWIALARRSIGLRAFADARTCALRAAVIDAGRPEAHNLLGVLAEIGGRRVDAQDQYRMALELDPTYQPAVRNLHRSASPPSKRGRFTLE